MIVTIAADNAAVAFLHALNENYDSAVSRCGQDRKTYRIFDSTINVDCAGETPRALLDAMQHCVSDSEGGADLTIKVLDSEATGVQIPEMPWDADDIREQGYIRGFNSERFFTNFNVDSMILAIIDLETNQGFLWRRSMQNVDYYERASPLRHILASWFAMKRNAHLVHSAIVGTDGKCALLAGVGGSGKSTTAAACMYDGMDYIADDYGLVALEPEPMAYSVYCTAKLYPYDLQKFPWLNEQVENRQILHKGKVVFYLANYPEANLVRRSRLAAVIAPVVTGQAQSTIEPISPATALLALAPSTIFQFWGPGNAQFKFLSELVRRVPCYSLGAGTNIDELPGMIRNLLEKLDG